MQTEEFPAHRRCNLALNFREDQGGDTATGHLLEEGAEAWPEACHYTEIFGNRKQLPEPDVWFQSGPQHHLQVHSGGLRGYHRRLCCGGDSLPIKP